MLLLNGIFRSSVEKFFWATLGIVFLTIPLQAQTIFSDSLDDNSAGWVFSALSNDVAGTVASQARFGFDYSDFSIPEAPNTQPGDTATLGATLQTNVGFGGEDQAAIRLADPGFTGSYTVQVDMWFNWAADAEAIGTTEHAGLYVGKDTVSDPADPDFPAQLGAGFIASTDGDCSNCDYVLLKNRAELDIYSGQYNVEEFGFGNQPGYDNSDANSDPLNGATVDFESSFPSFNISSVVGVGQPEIPIDLEQPAGTIGFQWVTLEAVVDPTAVGDGPGPGVGTATFSITNAASGEKIEIGKVDNSQPDILDDDLDGDDCQPSSEDPGSEDICTGETPVDLEGEIALVLLDFFPSIASDFNLAFALFDNVLVYETATSAGLPGDFNDDGTVDAADYTVYRDNLGLDSTSLNGNGSGDALVTSADYDLWVLNYGSTSTSSTSTAVPEPTTALLLLAGATGLLARRRR